MCSAAPSIGKGPSIQRPLSGHSAHGRTRCWAAPVAIVEFARRSFTSRALPEPCMNLSIHTAPDVRPLP